MLSAIPVLVVTARTEGHKHLSREVLGRSRYSESSFTLVDFRSAVQRCCMLRRGRRIPTQDKKSPNSIAVCAKGAGRRGPPALLDYPGRPS